MMNLSRLFLLSFILSGCGQLSVDSGYLTTSGIEIVQYEATSSVGKNVQFGVSCASGETLLGGGCSCAQSDGMTASVRNGEGWSCRCNGAPSEGLHRVVATCSKKSGLTRQEVTTLGAAPLTASCSAGSIRVGYGGFCGNSIETARVLNSVYDFSALGAKVDCQEDSMTASVTSYCLNSLVTISNKTQEFAMSGPRSTHRLACATGKALAMGGCICPLGEFLLESAPKLDFLTHQCTCTNFLGDGSVRIKLLCVD